MLRALQRSIFGRNCGASFCSTIMARTPRRPRSMASVKPVGPAPTMRTWISISPFTSPRLRPANGAREQTELAAVTSSPILRRGLEIGELGSFLHEVADGAFERLEAAVAGSAQGVLHLHGLEHQEGCAAQQICARLGENARHRAWHRRDDSAPCFRLAHLGGERVDPMQVEMPVRSCEIQIAAGPCRRNRFGRLAERNIESCLGTARTSERRLAPRIVQDYPFADIPQHRIEPLAAVPKAQ